MLKAIKPFYSKVFTEPELLRKYLQIIDNLERFHDIKLNYLYNVMYSYGWIGPDIIEVINDLIKKLEAGKNPTIFVKSRDNIIRYYGDIELVGYTVIYFNNDLANFLIGKAKSYHNNFYIPLQIQKALWNIKKTLTKCIVREDEWQNAAKAYNKAYKEVLDASERQFFDLEPIEIYIIPDQETSKKRKSLEEVTVENKKSTTEDNVDYIVNAEKDHDYSEEEEEDHGMLGDQSEESPEFT